VNSPAYLALLERVHQTHDLGKASAILSWDREVNMPPAGDPARVQQMTTLRKLIHQRSTSAEMGEAIEAAATDLAGADPASDEACLIRVLRRDFEKSSKMPEAFVVEMSQVGAKAWSVWKEARAEDDFARFLPHLERLIELQRERAALLGHQGEAYDALLDLYEEGSTTAEVRGLFDEVKAVSVPLVAEIRERGRPVDDRILHQPYPLDGQEAFARYIAQAVGYDFGRGHLATATHPFATSFSRDDARITTRWYPDFINPSLFGTLHECGHAIYEQGTAAGLARTPLARGTSSGIHESQSRMIENVVGRSLGFWRAHFVALQAQFPSQLGDASVEDFYAAINKVQPSLIRVEADELTYNLHIILRFELEQAMLSGELAAADLPAAWNDKLESLLGIRPPNDREGVLQDVHWSGPSFGYFPTYALGNLYAAQFFATARKADAAVERGLASGDTTALRAWLGENIHRHGRKFAPRELVQRATGRALESADFAAYVTEKFGALYEL
jgi:carboxypeptidase Taq